MLTDKERKLREIEENRRNIPPLDNLPEGEINWVEISDYILTDMNVVGLFWHYLDDETKTAKLSENSLAVLRMIRYDMYDFFYHHNVELERFDQWDAMEKYIRKKIQQTFGKSIIEADFRLSYKRQVKLWKNFHEPNAFSATQLWKSSIPAALRFSE